LAARAGSAPASSAAATRPMVMRRMMVRLLAAALLRGDDEVGAAVLRPRLLGVARVERELLPVADRADAVRRDAERDEVVARRDGAPFAKRQIVLRGAPLVAVPLDRDLPARVALQHVRVLLQHLLPLGVDLVLVERKEHGPERRVAVDVVERA